MEQSPWLLKPEAIAGDFDLETLRRSSIRRAPQPLADLDLEESQVTVLRGPRRVGKTTALKLLAERAIGQGFHDRVIYFSFDLDRKADHIVEVAKAARELFPQVRGSRIFLFDEISAVPDWQNAIKYLRDQTACRNDCFVLTGSSARDLKGGAERLPRTPRKGTPAEPCDPADEFSRIPAGARLSRPLPGASEAGRNRQRRTGPRIARVCGEGFRAQAAPRKQKKLYGGFRRPRRKFGNRGRGQNHAHRSRSRADSEGIRVRNHHFPRCSRSGRSREDHSRRTDTVGARPGPLVIATRSRARNPTTGTALVKSDKNKVLIGIVVSYSSRVRPLV